MSVPGSKGVASNKNGKTGMPSHKHHHHHHHHHHHQGAEPDYDIPDKILQSKAESIGDQQHYIPNSMTSGSSTSSGSSSRRPDTLVTNPMVRHLQDKNRPARPELVVRHSMDIDDRVNPNEESNLQDFRTRSQTLTDLNNMSLEESQQGTYQSGSQSTIASERSSNAAKLLHSSHNPGNFNSSQTIHKDGLGSPIWKPRHANLPPKKHVTLRETVSDERPTLESAVFSGSAYGDYSIYDEPRRTGHNLPPPGSHPRSDDTDC